MKHCYAIGGRINFNPSNISLCHGIDIGDQIIWRVGDKEEFTPEYYIRKTEEIDALNQTSKAICKGCSNLINDDKKNKIEVITICPMEYCQNRCVYCECFSGSKKESYNPLPIIKEFVQKGMIVENCLFDWGGGEPTFGYLFEDIFTYLLNAHYMQRVNTNAIRINSTLLNNLDNDYVSLRISLDAGNRETFFRTKGTDLFDDVVKNISMYRKKTDNIVLKYLINSMNSDLRSVRDFVNLAKTLKIKTICIDTEIRSYGALNYNGPLFFSDRELKAARFLESYARENGLTVQIGYVWTSHDFNTPSRDFNNLHDIRDLLTDYEQYSLPDKLYPAQIKRLKDFTNDIFAVPLSSYEYLVHLLKNKKVILYGADENGRRLLERMKKDCFCIKAIVDENLKGDIEGVHIISPSQLMEQLDDETVVIITLYKARDIILNFNRQNFIQLKDKLYKIDSSRF